MVVSALAMQMPDRTGVIALAGSVVAVHATATAGDCCSRHPPVGKDRAPDGDGCCTGEPAGVAVDDTGGAGEAACAGRERRQDSDAPAVLESVGSRDATIGNLRP